MRFILTLALLALPIGVSAQGRCLPHDEVVARLAALYGENRRSMGLADANTVIEVFASEAGTWTITMTRAGGPTCLVAAGQAWTAVDEPLPPAGEDG